MHSLQLLTRPCQVAFIEVGSSERPNIQVLAAGKASHSVLLEDKVFEVRKLAVLPAASFVVESCADAGSALTRIQRAGSGAGEREEEGGDGDEIRLEN
jgi:hypothetical protein